MKSVAVIAHTGKSLDGGLPALRRALDEHGVVNPLWCEVSKSKHAPDQVRGALEQGADLVFVWGGDGMVQRCVDVLAGSKATLAIVPAGTANLLASNLGIPKKLDRAVEIGLNGSHRKLDVGCMHGERFAVMAGAGFDAKVISEADGELKRHLGRMAYVLAASKNFHGEPFQAQVTIDGTEWYRGEASCVLLGNVGHIFGGISAFDHAQPDDGLLDVGVASAEGLVQWGRTIVRTSLSDASKSPFVHITQARSIEVTLDRKVLYQLDGGARSKTKKFRVEVEPAAVRVRVPEPQQSTRHAA
jgi:YegS/Rv2252/BmrU family lipid kinase